MVSRTIFITAIGLGGIGGRSRRLRRRGARHATGYQQKRAGQSEHPTGARHARSWQTRAALRRVWTRSRSGYSGGVAELAEWFLTSEERGNPASKIPAWCVGNRAEPLIHGATYFDQLVTEVEALGDGDYVFFTDWRGDPDEKMRDEGPTIRELFCKAAERGVVVKGLVWRSHLDKFAYSEEENQHLGEAIEQAGGEVLLDQRVRFGGSHHQKLVVIRHRDQPERDVAFAGGIDLCHSRRDDESHRGDRQASSDGQGVRRAPAVARCAASRAGAGRRCARHHVPGTVDRSRRRWTCLSPIAWLADKLRGADLDAGAAAGSAAGSAAVRAAHHSGASHLPRRPFRVRLRATR